MTIFLLSYVVIFLTHKFVPKSEEFASQVLLTNAALKIDHYLICWFLLFTFMHVLW